jgi:hypothetical protein
MLHLVLHHRRAEVVPSFTSAPTQYEFSKQHRAMTLASTIEPLSSKVIAAFKLRCDQEGFSGQTRCAADREGPENWCRHRFTYQECIGGVNLVRATLIWLKCYFGGRRGWSGLLAPAGKIDSLRSALSSSSLLFWLAIVYRERLRGRFEISCQACSSSSKAVASFRSSVSKPSVNQP